MNVFMSFFLSNSVEVPIQKNTYMKRMNLTIIKDNMS